MHVSFFQIVTYGAVVSYLNVTDRAFENYANGIYSGCTSKSINHAVLVIGYGVEKQR
jgi:C1A family cysteine protease